MRYIYLITHAVDYEGETIIAVKTNKHDAIEYAENNLGGDDTIVIRYPVGWDCNGPIKFVQGDWIIAKWKCIHRVGAGYEFERIK